MNAFGFLVIASSVLGTTSATAADTAGGRWVVQIHIYSGRPDPEYTLTGPEVERVRQALTTATASKATSAAVLAPVLGYRGVTITESQDIGRVTYEIQLSRGRITTNAGGSRAYLAAGSVDIEGYLLDLAVKKGVVDRPVYESILQMRLTESLQSPTGK